MSQDTQQHPNTHVLYGRREPSLAGQSGITVNGETALSEKVEKRASGLSLGAGERTVLGLPLCHRRGRSELSHSTLISPLCSSQLRSLVWEISFLERLGKPVF